MAELLVKQHAPDIDHRVLSITPESAGWRYVGFELFTLEPQSIVAKSTGEREALLVLIEGRAEVAVGGETLGEIGERMNVFDGTKPYAVYAPSGSQWRVQATTACTLAVGTAPGRGRRTARVIAPDDVTPVTRGKGSNTRRIHPILMEDRDWADSLLVTEVFTPAGHWSSYPPHRHDEDDYPNVTYLEEIYYHRLHPAQGFGLQRVFTEDGTLDETMAVADGDVVLVPRGHHPCAAPYGYEMYYLNVMAGPMRKWRFKNHPDHDWIARRDAGDAA